MRTICVTCVLFIGLALAIPAAPAATEVNDEATQEMTDLASEIEIMRLVLTKSINRGFGELLGERHPTAKGDEPKPAGDLTTTYEAAVATNLYALRRSSWQRPSFTSHTRGFYAEDLGAIFTSEVQTPVREARPGEVEAPPPEPDEWAEAADEVRGLPRVTRGGGGTLYHALVDPSGPDTAGPSERHIIDPEFVEAAITSVLSMLAKHGLKMEGLPEDDEIVVALYLTPCALPVLGRADEPVDPLGAALRTSYASFGAPSAPEKHLVIRVPKHRLGDPEEAAIDVKELRQHATITLY